MRSKIIFLVLSLFFKTGFAQKPEDSLAEVAAKLEGTIFVVPHRESVEGIVTACGLEFSALKRDFSTKRGAPVKIAGSFYIRSANKGGVFYALKIGITDDLAGNETSSAPANAFISAPRGKAPTKAKRTSAESSAYALFVGTVDGDVVDAYQAIAEQKQLVVGFNRVPGQMDVTTTLDLTVVDTKMQGSKVLRENSRKMVDDFIDCTNGLLKTVGK